MPEDKLAALFNFVMLKKFKLEEAELIWEVAKQLAALVQPKKSYAKLYNSAEGRQQIKKLTSKK